MSGARGFLLALLASVALVLLFYSTILFEGWLARGDWVMNCDYYHWIRISFTEFGAVPFFDYRAGHSQNLVANPESPLLGPLVWLLLLLPADTYVRLLIVLYTSAGLLGTFYLARDLGVAAPIAILCAVLVSLNGFVVAQLGVGHHMILGFGLLPVMMLLYRRAVRGSWLALAATALVNALVILEGFNSPFVWHNLFLSLYALFWAIQIGSPRPLWIWGGIALASAGLMGVKLLPMLCEFWAYDPTQVIGGFPPLAALFSLVARGQAIDTEYPGVRFLYGSGWWEYDFYIGALASLLLALGLSAARRAWPLAAVGAVFLLLSLDWPDGLRFLNLWDAVREWPILRSQRAPSRWLGLAIVAFVLYAGVGLQRLWESTALARHRRLAMAAAAALVALILVDLHLESRRWQRVALADAPLSREHRPPRRYATPAGGAPVELLEFTPNRLVYSVETPRPELVPLPFSWEQRDEWRVEGFAARKHGDRIAVAVPAGRHEIAMSFRPRLLGAGIAVSALCLCALAASFGLPRGARERLLDALGGPEALARDPRRATMPAPIE
jgi:hypothetical protein